MPNVRFKKDFLQKSGKNRDFLAILEQFLGFYQIFFNLWFDILQLNLYCLKKDNLVLILLES